MSRRKFQRNLPFLNYKKLYLIAVEDKTERLYFQMFSRRDATFRIEIPKSMTRSAPINVFNVAKMAVKKESWRNGDEVWIVIDHDNRQEVEIQTVYEACKSAGYELALSYPKFEYWLLLHFADGHGKPSPSEIDSRLKSYLKNFSKGTLDVAKLKPKIADAIRRAKAKEDPTCNDWLRTHGSMLYKLVEKIY